MSSQQTQPLHIRVFLASPGDVADERALAQRVLDRLGYDALLRGRITLETVAWDKPGGGVPMRATMTPQEAINQGLSKPSECDIVIVLVWSRMGTPLPAEYRKPNGEPYLSGTEWEYCDALRASEQNNRPQVLVYRRTEVPSLLPTDPDFDNKVQQWRRVETFFKSFYNPDGSIRGGVNDYDTPDTFEKSLDQHLRVVIRELLQNPENQPTEPETPAPPADTATATAALWEGSPFPGLRAFGEDDAPIFFGRGRETDGLVSRLANGARFVAVAGASGSGKSSLVAAGLLPRLKANAIPGSQDWVHLSFTPGKFRDDPFMAMANAVEPLLEKQGRRVRDEAEQLRQNPKALDELSALVLTERPAWAELLLFIDQFEELFTVVAADFREPFIDLLDRAAKTERIRIIVTLRADFYHRCIEWPVLAEWLRLGSYPLAPPGVGALYEMIERPAERAGLRFEKGLVQRLLDDSGGEPGALPLLAFALAELYRAKTEDRQLTHAAYEAFEGVKGAISKRAEDTFARLERDAQSSLDRVFRELVEVEHAETGWVATRRRAPLDEAAPTTAANKLVAAFTDARLLVQSQGENNTPMVEVAHEALLRNWPRLVDRIEKTGDDLRLLNQLRQSASEWKEHEHSGDYLWPRTRRLQAEAMTERLEPQLAETERRFLRASTVRSGWKFSAVAVGFTTVTVVVGLFLWAYSIGVTMAFVPTLLLAQLGLSYNEPEMAEIPAGKFMMGSPEDEEGWYSNERQHEVVIEEPFFIGKYEVTFDQYDLFALLTERRIPIDYGWGRGQRPVVDVTWDDALAYAQWLSEKTGKEYRLPTEAEWEYAARGGTQTAYWWGNEVGVGNANCSGCGSDWDYTSTAPVGSFETNAFGLYDTAGNVWEWTCSEYKEDYDGAETECTSNNDANSAPRVLRGGSWGYDPRWVRSAFRLWGARSDRDFFIGFRLARSF